MSITQASTFPGPIYLKHRVVFESIIVGVVLTGISFLVGILAGWIQQVNYLEAFAVFTSYACTYLCVKQKRINYAFGIVSTAAYAILFFDQGLIASALLNAYLAPSLVYGWIRWKSDSESRPVRHVSLKWVPVYLAVTAVAYLGATLIVNALGGRMAPADALILVGSILAQFLLDNKILSTWYVWVVVNIAAIYVYLSAGLYLAGFQYCLFLINAFWGAYEWKKSMVLDEAKNL